MAKSKEDNKEALLEVCYFKVPLIITQNEKGEDIANFEEVEMKDLCFKKEDLTGETREEVILKSQDIANYNLNVLKTAIHMKKKTGETMIKKVVCKKGKVEINKDLIK